MKFNFPINNLGSGEWSPFMAARTDTDQYTRSCETLLNVIPQMTGGGSYRGGFVVEPIEDNDLRNYLNSYISDNGMNSISDFAIMSYTPYNPTYNTKFIITPGGWFLIPSGVEVVYGATDGDVEDELGTWTSNLTQYQQIGDLLVLLNLNGDQKPKVFYYDTVTSQYRLDFIDGQYITSEAWKTIPWAKPEALNSNVTMNIDGVTVGVGATLTTDSAYFTGSMVGKYVRLCNGTSPDGVVKIIDINSSTSAEVVVRKAPHSTAFAYGDTANPASFWQVSDWGYDVGWPRTVTAHQGRIIFGGNAEKPDTIWGSRVSNYFDFEEIPSPNTTGVGSFDGGAYALDNNRPFTLTPNSQEASNIYALSSSKALVINTDRSEIVAYGTNGNLGPNNATFESSTSYGADQVKPVRVNNYLTFVQAGGRKVRDIIFDFNEDQFKSNDLAFVADHLFLLDGDIKGIDKIVQMAKTENKSSLLFARTMSGRIYGVTLDRDYQINAWFRVEIGGAPEDTGSNTYGVKNPIGSMCTFPQDANNPSTLYVLMAREVGGGHVVTVEALQQSWETGNPFNEALATDWSPPGDAIYPVYLDCAKIVTKEGSDATTTFKTATDSVNYYANNTVSVVADGTYLGEFTVANDADGTLVLPDPYNLIVIGYKYRGIIKPSPIEQGGQTGQPVGRFKRVDELVVRFVQTGSAEYGKSLDALTSITIRETAQDTDIGLVFFSGDKVVTFPPGYERRCQVIIVQDAPYPMHIVGIIPRGITYD